MKGSSFVIGFVVATFLATTGVSSDQATAMRALLSHPSGSGTEVRGAWLGAGRRVIVTTTDTSLPRTSREAWSTTLSIVGADAGRRVIVTTTDTSLPRTSREAWSTALSIVGADGEKLLSTMEGFCAGEVQTLSPRLGFDRIAVSGGLSLNGGDPMWTLRVIELRPEGAKITFDSSLLRESFKCGTGVRLDQQGRFWVAVSQDPRFVGVRVAGGSTEDSRPRWSATVTDERPWGGKWAASGDEYDAVPLGEKIAAVLVRGRVYIVGDTRNPDSASVLQPTLSSGRMLFADPDLQVVAVYEEDTDDISVFVLGQMKPTAAGTVAPSFVLSEQSTGLHSAEIAGVSGGRILLAGCVAGSGGTFILSVDPTSRLDGKTSGRASLLSTKLTESVDVSGDGRFLQWTTKARDGSIELLALPVEDLSR